MIPLFGWIGIVTLISLLFTASIPFLVRRGKLSMKWHFFMAKLSISLAIIHGIFAILKYF